TGRYVGTPGRAASLPLLSLPPAERGHPHRRLGSAFADGPGAALRGRVGVGRDALGPRPDAIPCFAHAKSRLTHRSSLLSPNVEGRGSFRVDRDGRSCQGFFVAVVRRVLRNAARRSRPRAARGPEVEGRAPPTCARWNGERSCATR